MPLTALQVQRAKPGRHSDGKGLYLLVQPKPRDPAVGGAKSWVLRVQVGGKRSDYGLGSCINERAVPSTLPVEQRRELTLAEARQKAAAGRSIAKAGLVPSKVWSRVEAVIPAFEETARGYHTEVKKGWRNGKHGDQWLNTLETYAFPTLGPKLVSDITAPDIQAVLMPIWLTKGETARRVRQRIAVVLDYAKGKGWRETEAPMRAVAQLMKGIAQPKGGNFEALPWTGVPALVKALRDSEPSVGRYALLFLIFTAARSGEIRGATWGEIDFERVEWKIPPERMKAGRLHIVPLVPAAVDILQEMRGLFGGKPSEPIFPGMRGKPMSDATLAKALRVAGCAATVHGLRSSFRDWAAESGFADAWAEAALAHGNPDRTEAAYRRTTFIAQRRDKLMPAWARFALEDSSNVVSLAAKAG
jgi:integrase